MNMALLRVIVGANRLYETRIWFLGIIKKFKFLFCTFQMGSTSRPFVCSHNTKSCFLTIFKLHLLVSVPAIFRETPLSYTTRGYYKLVEYQLLYSFVYHLPCAVNMLAKIDISIMGWGRFFAIFKMHLRVSAPPIFRETPLSNTTLGYYTMVEYQFWTHSYTTCHGLWTWSQKSKFPLWEEVDFLQFSKCISS